MSNEQSTKNDEKDREHVHCAPAPSSGCPKCGAAMKSNMFRTGSVNHPGGRMNVCTHCGARG